MTETGLEPTANSIKKRLQRRCFPLKFARFLRTSILKNICEQLLFQDIREDVVTTFPNLGGRAFSCKKKGEIRESLLI